MTNNFHKFATLINERAKHLASINLFKVDMGEIDLKEIYLAAFPEGTNPTFRSKTEHDCSCCKNFIRNVGALVAVKDGKVLTVWDVEGIPAPYDTVAAALHKAVVNAPIATAWFTTEAKYGSEHTKGTIDGNVVTFDHFWFDVPVQYRSTSPGEQAGKINSDIQVAQRGVEELALGAIDAVLDLIAEGALYRGDEHKKALESFKALRLKYAESPSHLFGYENYNAPAARIRNTVIGSLLIDLSDGMDLERAVKSFEAKVAPANYKRPKALITQGMIDQAVKTMQAEGLADSLQRRHATLSDVHVNDVLWVSNHKASVMQGGAAALGDILKKSIKQTASDSAAELSIEQFMPMLNNFTGIEAFVGGSLAGNLMCVTAPMYADAPPLFKWDSGFAWSYRGGVTDSIKERVKAAGGRIDAEFRISLSWFNTDDLDLHLFEPGGSGEVYFGAKRGRYGSLDVDMNAGWSGFSREPVENYAGRAAVGEYQCFVHNFNKRNTDDVGCTIEVEYKGVLRQYTFSQPIANEQNLRFYVQVDASGFEVEFADAGWSEGTGPGVTVWGVQQESWVPVTTIMLSPNYWQGREMGNKHTFFLLEGCGSDEEVRGLYNEFLRPDLDKHRKVFEVLAAKTKIAPAAEQLAGLGFSSTQRNSVTLRCVDKAGKQRQYKVNF